MAESVQPTVRSMLMAVVLAASAAHGSQANEERDADQVEVTGSHSRQKFVAGASVRIVDARPTDAFVARHG